MVQGCCYRLVASLLDLPGLFQIGYTRRVSRTPARCLYLRLRLYLEIEGSKEGKQANGAAQYPQAHGRPCRVEKAKRGEKVRSDGAHSPSSAIQRRRDQS